MPDGRRRLCPVRRATGIQAGIATSTAATTVDTAAGGDRMQPATDRCGRLCLPAAGVQLASRALIRPRSSAAARRSGRAVAR